MAKRHQPDGTPEHKDGSAAFPENPTHLQEYTSPGGLTYFYTFSDPTDPNSPGYWTMLGYPGPPGPLGPQGPGGLTGSYPTINYETGTWDLAHQEYDKDNNLIDINEPTDYPAQGTVRVLGVVGYGGLPTPSGQNLGDAYYVEEYDDDGIAITSKLNVIPYHDHKFSNGNVDTGKNRWVEVGNTGALGPQGEQGEQGPKGDPGGSFIEVVDYFPAGALYQEGQMLMELSTKTIFVAVNPAIQ